MINLTFVEIPFLTPAYDEALALRNDLLRVPLGLSFKKEDLAQEYAQHHLVAYDEQWNMLACLVLKPINATTIKMRQVAVKANLQHQRLGSRLVQFAESFCLERGYSTIVLHARAEVIPFYEKVAYQKEGKAFYEVEIKHYKMSKVLP